MSGGGKKRLTALEKRVRRQVRARKHAFFAVFQPGFERAALAELRAMGISEILEVAEGGVEFSGTLDDCFRVNLLSRTVIRVIMRLAAFRADAFAVLREKAEAVPWELYLGPACDISFNVTCRKSRLYHSGAVAEHLAAAVGARMASQCVPVSFSGGEGSQTVFVRIDHDRCVLSLDSTGGPLYRRGHKTLVTRATLRETTAALMLLEAGIGNYRMLLDPFCGSGTFSLEAAAMAKRMIPGMDREFPFMKWPAFGAAAYNHLRGRLVNEAPGNSVISVIASDIDPGAVDVARANISSAGLDDVCSVETRDFFAGRVEIPPDRRCLIVMNPPYGERLKGRDVAGLYRMIGETVRSWYGECGYAIIVPGLETEKALSLPHDRKVLFMNGGIRVAALFRDARPCPA